MRIIAIASNMQDEIPLKVPKGYKITTPKCKSKGYGDWFEAHVWKNGGSFPSIMPTLFDSPSKAKRGAIGWIEECNKKI